MELAGATTGASWEKEYSTDVRSRCVQPCLLLTSLFLEKHDEPHHKALEISAFSYNSICGRGGRPIQSDKHRDSWGHWVVHMTDRWDRLGMAGFKTSGKLLFLSLSFPPPRSFLHVEATFRLWFSASSSFRFVWPFQLVPPTEQEVFFHLSFWICPFWTHPWSVGCGSTTGLLGYRPASGAARQRGRGGEGERLFQTRLKLWEGQFFRRQMRALL